jgi:hypothetical protein
MSEHLNHEPTTVAQRRGAAGDRLAVLRSRIAHVGRHRRLMRRLSVASRVALAVVIAAVALFLVDWFFAPGRLARLLMLGVAAAGIARVCWRLRRRGALVRESEADVALLIEKQEGIDSDLVAALEFARGGAAAGSADLRDAVVEYVADYGRSWQMPRQPVDAKLRRRLSWLAVAAGIVGVAVLMRPDFAATFVRRMLLGVAHYPTRTRIESLVIAGRGVDPTPGAAATASCPLGRPIAFEVGIGGEQPRIVRMRLQSVATGGTTEIELSSDAALQAADGQAAGVPSGERPPATTTYAARVPRLAETVDVQVFAGDAWTEPVRVRAIPPPLVDLAISATAPGYAGGRVERAPEGARQVAVSEGSRVEFGLRCTNKKLQSAALVIDGAEYPLRPRNAAGMAAADSAAEWELAASAAPLTRLERTVAYEVRVVDEDGLGADMPLVGSIRVKPDAPPRVTAQVQTRLVLPAASPRVAWKVADDHAIARVEVLVEPVPAGESNPAVEPGTGAPASQSAGSVAIPIQLPTGGGVAASGGGSGSHGWVGGDRLPLEGTATVKLGGFGLEVGDQVRVVVRAVDYRGDAAGREAVSDPILLQVTDERGVVAAINESDEQAIEQLDAIIDRELSVGGAR